MNRMDKHIFRENRENTRWFASAAGSLFLAGPVLAKCHRTMTTALNKDGSMRRIGYEKLSTTVGVKNDKYAQGGRGRSSQTTIRQRLAIYGPARRVDFDIVYPRFRDAADKGVGRKDGKVP